MLTQWRNLSWLGEYQRRRGYTEQPAKYLSGFLFGFILFSVITLVLLLGAVALGIAPASAAWVFVLPVLLGALLMGFAE